MAESTTQHRLTRLEAEQAQARQELEAHAAWFRRMEVLTAEGWELHRETQSENREAHREFQEEQRETARMIRDLRKEMAALGQKFGGFAEGMALPSMERCLAERFGTTGFMARVRKRFGGRELEIDALAYADGDADVACVVEVKSRLRDDGIDQLLRALNAFPHFFPEHQGKKPLGVLAAVDIPEELRRRVLSEGLVLATIRDDVFELQVPEGFEPTAFLNNGASAAAPGDGSGGAS